MSTLLLTDDELTELTGRRRVDAQERELRALGIPFGRRTDGALVVLRSVVVQLLGGGVARATMTRPEPQLMP
jgi:hypothetical protein